MKLNELEKFCNTLKNDIDRIYADKIDKSTLLESMNRYEQIVIDSEKTIDKFLSITKRFGKFE